MLDLSIKNAAIMETLPSFKNFIAFFTHKFSSRYLSV